MESTQEPSDALAQLEQFLEIVCTAEYPNSAELERWENILIGIVAVLKAEHGASDHHLLTQSLEERFSRVEKMVESIAQEVAPIVAELAGSPIVKMLTGGKKRD